MNAIEKRLLLSLPLVGSLAVLGLMAALGLISFGRTPEYAILVVMLLIVPSLALISWWITYGFNKKETK